MTKTKKAKTKKGARRKMTQAEFDGIRKDRHAMLSIPALCIKYGRGGGTINKVLDGKIPPYLMRTTAPHTNASNLDKRTRKDALQVAIINALSDYLPEIAARIAKDARAEVLAQVKEAVDGR